MRKITHSEFAIITLHLLSATGLDLCTYEFRSTLDPKCRNLYGFHDGSRLGRASVTSVSDGKPSR